jgi:hypothetical protein
LGRVLSASDLPLAELCSARIDGELFALGDGWCVVDEPEGAECRAAAAALLAPRRAIAERGTAAWIYGAAAEPSRHQFCIDVGARVNVPASPRVHLREVVGVEANTLCIGGLRVTTPIRTVLDLARQSTVESTNVIPVLRRLLQDYGITAQTALAGIPAGSSHRADLVSRITAAEGPQEARCFVMQPT